MKASTEAVRRRTKEVTMRRDSDRHRLLHDDELVRELRGTPAGQPALSESRPGTCAVLVELRTDRSDDDVVRTELQRAVASLSQRALADDSTEDTGRAWH
jgi:hypothetical protein